MCSHLMGDKGEEKVYVILPLEHDRCKAQPRLTPEEAQIVSGHLQRNDVQYTIRHHLFTIEVSIATLVAMLLLIYPQFDGIMGENDDEESCCIPAARGGRWQGVR